MLLEPGGDAARTGSTLDYRMTGDQKQHNRIMLNVPGALWSKSTSIEALHRTKGPEDSVTILPGSGCEIMEMTELRLLS